MEHMGFCILPSLDRMDETPYKKGFKPGEINLKKFQDYSVQAQNWN